MYVEYYLYLNCHRKRTVKNYVCESAVTGGETLPFSFSPLCTCVLFPSTDCAPLPAPFCSPPFPFNFIFLRTLAAENVSIIAL